jgi:DNA-binding NarL/FixJ family response regulator
MEKIKVLLADDHSLFLEGLSPLLEKEEDITIVAKATNTEEAISLTAELLPDVVTLDISMPSVGGIEAARQIKMLCPRTAIIILTAYGYESYISASLEVGVAGYLLKNSPINKLIDAIRMVYAGEAVFSFQSASQIIHQLIAGATKTGQKSLVLSPREIEVLNLAARGLTNKEIAREFVLSERTVQTHLVNIFKKLKVGSRTEAVLYALKENWLALDNIFKETKRED